jgi:CBS domain containing-hemolysin-like protein
MQNLVLIILPLCLAVSFLCAGMEAGIFALGRWRIAQQMREGKQRAARLYSYLQNTENFLWTILVGNTLAAFGALWISGVTLINRVPNTPGFWLGFVLIVFVFYVFCDLLPKMLFRAFPNRLCLLLSAPFRILHLVLSPIVAVIEGLAGLLLRWTGGKIFRGHVFSSRNELRLLMAENSEALTSEERGMINRVFELHNISVRQIALPFGHFPSLPHDAEVAEAVEIFRGSSLNILPVWKDEKLRRIAGFLNLKKVMYLQPIPLKEKLGRHLMPPLYVDEDVRVQEALRRMQRTGYRIAVIISRDQREIGLITLEEILKVIFGEVKF